MPDMIPAARIAEIALRHIREAEAKVDDAVYSTEARAAVKRSMAAATELMALIVPPPFIVPGGTASGTGPISRASIADPGAVMLAPLTMAPQPLASGGLVSGVGILVGDVDRSPPPLTDL